MKLTPEQRRALEVGAFIAPRPGSNMWPFVELEHPDGNIDGEVVSDLIRIGLFAGFPRREPVTLITTEDYIGECDVDCDFDYDITADGRAALEQKDEDDE